MKRSFSFLAVTALVIGVLGGCASNRHSFSALNDTYNATVATLNSAYDSGAIPQEEWDTTVEPAISAGDILLDSYDAMTKAGFDGEVVAEQLKAVIKKLQPFVTRFIQQ